MMKKSAFEILDMAAYWFDDGSLCSSEKIFSCLVRSFMIRSGTVWIIASCNDDNEHSLVYADNFSPQEAEIIEDFSFSHRGRQVFEFTSNRV